MSEATNDYVAWCRYTENGSIVTCDSDSPKAFKVYRNRCHDHTHALAAFAQRVVASFWDDAENKWDWTPKDYERAVLAQLPATADLEYQLALTVAKIEEAGW